MTVKITGIAAARREFQDIQDFLASKKPMRGIVDDIQDGIATKTAMGHDYKGRNFAPYSDSYKKVRSSKGLTTKPDLAVTGAMISALKSSVIDPRHGRVEIAPVAHSGLMTDMLAQVHNLGTTNAGKGNNVTIPQREFMAITENAKKVLAKKHYNDPLLEITRRYR